ncbi:MAG: GNAT family N-acetyltransferase [Oscillospiraceae bacterium]
MEREIYAAGEGYILSPMTAADREDYEELQQQTYGEDSDCHTPEQKDKMWDKILKSKANRNFSIFDEHGDYCGCIELMNFQSTTPEIGLTISESKRNQGIAAKVVKLLVQKACSEQEIEYFEVKIKAENSHSRHVFEKLGAVKIGEEEYALAMLRRFLNERELELVRMAMNTAKEEAADTELTKAMYQYKLSPKVFEEVKE